jgi:type II secretory pathway pseudopilin PulG
VITNKHRRLSGFSLVEVTLAIGIVAFALLAIIGLIPTGLRSVQDATQQARASDILKLAATAVQSQYYLGSNGGVGNYSFANFLSTWDPASVATDTAFPWDKHTKYYLGQSAWPFTFDVLDDCSIRQSADTTPPRYKLYIFVTPPVDSMKPVRVYLSVAWPGSAIASTDVSGAPGWTNNQGHVETTVYANPPKPK